MSVIGKEKNYILQLSNINEKDIGLVGEEGLRLALLESLEIDIPETFIITSLAFDDFLTAANIVDDIVGALSEVEPENELSAKEASEKITDLIKKSSFPSLFINPLNTAYDSVGKGKDIHFVLKPIWILDEQMVEELGIINPNLENNFKEFVFGHEELLEGLKNTWATLFTPEAVLERSNKSYGGSLSVAVIAQRILQGEASGYSISRMKKDDYKDGVISVRAKYGIDDLSNSPEENNTEEFDNYLIDRTDLRISEKNIKEQNEMVLLKGRPQKAAENKHYVKIPISEHWQNSQKIDDKTINNIARISLDIEKEMKYEVELRFTTQGKKIYISEVNEYIDNTQITEKIDISIEKDNDEIVNDLPDRKKKEIDFSSLVEEVEQDAISQPEVDDDLILSRSIKEDTDIDGLASISLEQEIIHNRNIEDSYDFGSLDIDIPNTMSSFGIDISDFKSEKIDNADKYTAVKLDMNEVLQSDSLFPEDFISDTEETNKKIQYLVNEISTAAKIANSSKLFVLASNYSSDTYHANGKPIGPISSERFVNLPELLAFEYIAVKKTKRDYGISSLYFVLPDIRNGNVLINLKHTLTQNGFRRGMTQKLGINFNTPASEILLDELETKDIDFGYIQMDLFISNTLGMSIFEEDDLPIIEKRLNNLVQSLKSKNIETILDLGKSKRFLDSALDKKADYIILSDLLNESDIPVISEHEVDTKDLKKKKGRKRKEI